MDVFIIYTPSLPANSVKDMSTESHNEIVSILYLRDTNKICGPGKTILNTCRAIDRKKWRLVVAATKCDDNKLLSAVIKTGTKAIPIHIGSFISIRSIIEVINIIKKENIMLIQTHDSQTRRIGVIAAILTGRVHISSVHGWIQNTAKAKIATFVDKMFLRFSKIIIVMSQLMREQLLEKGISDHKIIVIHNAIFLDDYKCNAISYNLREEYQIDENENIVAIIGRISEEKRHKFFVSIAQRIISINDNTRFLIVGDGPLLNDVKKYVRDKGVDKKFIFTGYRTDVNNIYPAINILAITSSTEGLPNVLLEAFAFNVPVIATNVGAIPEVIEDGVNGFIVQINNQETFIERLTFLLRDNEYSKNMGRMGRKTIEEKFNFVQRTRKIEKLYRTVTGIDK